MKHKGLIIALVVAGLVAGSFFFGMFVYLVAGDGGRYEGFAGSSGVGMVSVDGPIMSADETVEDIEHFRKDGDIKAVIFRIESPGGSIAASQEILEAISLLAQKKPVVASMGSVAASGGYYIALGATKILANPGTVTGSIGVRLEHVMIGDLLKFAKIQHETIKSGKFKDMASIDRPMTPEEREIFQRMLDDMHRQFKEAVAKARNIDMENVDEIADGRVYTGRQALDLKLVDELGGLADATNLAAKLAGIKGEPKIVRPKKGHPFLERFLRSTAGALAKESAAGLINYWQPFMVMK